MLLVTMLIWLKKQDDTLYDLNAKINLAVAGLMIVGFLVSTILNPIIFYYHW